MSIEKKKTQHRVEFIGEFKHVIVETKTAYIEDGVEIEGTATYHRDSFNCGDFDKASALGIRDLVDVAWTPAVVEAYRLHQEQVSDAVYD